MSKKSSCNYCQESYSKFEVTGLKKQADDSFQPYQLCFKCNNQLSSLNPKTKLKERQAFWHTILKNAKNALKETAAISA